MNLKTLFVLLLILFFCFHYFNREYTNTPTVYEDNSLRLLSFDDNIVQLRDFHRYNCGNIKRIGGKALRLTDTPDVLMSIDGAYFICFDDGLKLKPNDCTVLSFGIRDDPSFDKAILDDYKCNVHSFDPFYEDKIVEDVRQSKPEYANTVEVRLASEWMFYNMGIAGSVDRVQNANQRSWLNTFDSILTYINHRDQIIDILKIDVEGEELLVIANMNMDYMCKYVKQFLFETHPISQTKSESLAFLIVIKRLEQCFRLFHRVNRFYQWTIDKSNQSYDKCLHENPLETEAKKLVSGELYFINKNFIRPI